MPPLALALQSFQHERGVKSLTHLFDSMKDKVKGGLLLVQDWDRVKSASNVGNCSQPLFVSPALSFGQGKSVIFSQIEKES